MNMTEPATGVFKYSTGFGRCPWMEGGACWSYDLIQFFFFWCACVCVKLWGNTSFIGYLTACYAMHNVEIFFIYFPSHYYFSKCHNQRRVYFRHFNIFIIWFRISIDHCQGKLRCISISAVVLTWQNISNTPLQDISLRNMASPYHKKTLSVAQVAGFTCCQLSVSHCRTRTARGKFTHVTASDSLHRYYTHSTALSAFL